jgi:adenylate kinase family enzyme
MGAGKSTVARPLLSHTGLRSVNLDNFNELFVKKGQVPTGHLSPDQLEKSWQLTQAQQKSFIDSRLGVIIDGSGRNPDTAIGVIEKLMPLGYEFMMIFVNVSEATSIARQQSRAEKQKQQWGAGRQVDPTLAKNTYAQVQKMLGKYSAYFGPQKFVYVDNENTPDLEPAEKKVDAFLRAPITQPEAIEWIQSQKGGQQVAQKQQKLATAQDRQQQALTQFKKGPFNSKFSKPITREGAEKSTAVSQEQLNQLYSKGKPMQFIKNTPVALVPLAKIDKIGTPQQVQQVQQALGSVDQTSYTDEYKNKGYVVFQWNGTALDLYVASPEVVSQKYVKFNGQLPQDEKSRGKIPSLVALSKLGIDPSKVPFFVKKVPNEMVSAKQLGLEGKTIQVFWGSDPSTQEVAPGGFLTKNEHGMIYTIAPDAQGLPIGYLPAQQGVSEGGYQHGFADPNAPSLGGSGRKDDEGNSEFDDRQRRQTGMIFYNVDDAETARAIGLQQTRTGKWYLRTGNRHAQQSADRAFGLGRIWYPESVEEAGVFGFMTHEPEKPVVKKPKLTLSQIRDLSKQEDEKTARYVRSNDLPDNPDHMRVVHDDVELSELSNKLLGKYKRELGVRASAADRAGDYDAGHEYFKKINRATVRQGENDARRHAEKEKENDVMETRLNMMRKAGYDL